MKQLRQIAVILLALELSWRVFLEFEAPEYSAEGVAAFRASLDDEECTRKLTFYGAYDGETLVGVLCMRSPQHIGGFFVDAAYHRRGIGKRLFEAMRRDYDRQVFTVSGLEKERINESEAGKAVGGLPAAA